MYIYLSRNTIFVLIFIVGLILGAIIHWITTRPRKTPSPIDYYDGTHGMGYQPLANQGQRPPPPKSEMPPLKKPKKAPPKPPHNPHK